MVKINTRDFGEKEIDEKDIIRFPSGIFAFEEARNFALISPLGENVFPMWLQCTDSVSPCFIVFDPTLIDGAYHVSLSKNEEETLGTANADKLRCLAIAKVPEDFRRTTVNMKSPIVINTENRTAMQVILPFDYEFRLPIYLKEEGAD